MAPLMKSIRLQRNFGNGPIMYLTASVMPMVKAAMHIQQKEVKISSSTVLPRSGPNF
jgi:hypothetical protein